MLSLSRRLEIAFWTGWVSAIRAMHLAPVARGASILLMLACCLMGWMLVKTSTSYLESGLVSLGFFRGLTPASANAGGDGTQEMAWTGPMALPATSGTNDYAAATQVNVLLLVVDRLGGISPRLQGVWLLVTDPQKHGLTFLPLYPSANSDLSRAFRLDPSGAPSQAFLEAVRQKGVWWHHYLALDYASLSALVELVGGVQLGGTRLRGVEAVTNLLSPARAPEAMLEGQASLFESICLQSAGLLANADPDLVTGLLTGSDERSNISPEVFQQGWIYASQAGGLTCEFPTVLGR